MQYSVLLENHMEKLVDFNLVGFKALYPSLIYPGVQPKRNKHGIQFTKKCPRIIKWYLPLTWYKAYQKLKDGDLIHINWFTPLMGPLYYTILKLNKKKLPVVMTCHNIEPHENTPIDNLMTKRIFSFVDYFVVHAEQNKKRLIKNYGINRDNIQVIPHGPFDYFTKWSKDSKTKLKKFFHFKKEDRVILFFGYIKSYKGLHHLLNAMPKVIEKNPDVKLLIGGELWLGRKYVDNILEKNNLKKYVRIYPRYVQDYDVHKFFDVADIYVLPNNNKEQTISGPLLVGLAFGKPTIISPVGGVPELIKDGINGILSPCGNEQKLANNINTLINNKKLQRKLSRNAKRTSKKFSWKTVAEQYMEVYKKAVGIKK
ncbi:MAG: glycosyltransferase family 4 protein [Nanoarchaeota archaeon]|nr:glycosyltransferase family 4 protein [Nanoarchaeota archaeon]